LSAPVIADGILKACGSNQRHPLKELRLKTVERLKTSDGEAFHVLHN
jgi:hypothetical protein